MIIKNTRECIHICIKIKRKSNKRLNRYNLEWTPTGNRILYFIVYVSVCESVKVFFLFFFLKKRKRFLCNYFYIFIFLLHSFFKRYLSFDGNRWSYADEGRHIYPTLLLRFVPMCFRISSWKDRT